MDTKSPLFLQIDPLFKWPQSQASKQVQPIEEKTIGALHFSLYISISYKNPEDLGSYQASRDFAAQCSRKTLTDNWDDSASLWLQGGS